MIFTESITWTNVPGAADATAATATEEDRRVIGIMPPPPNATLHQCIKNLAHVRMELTALQTGEEDAALKKLDMRVKEEQEVVVSQMNRVCEAAVGWVLLIRRLVGGSEAEHVSGAMYVRTKSK